MTGLVEFLRARYTERRALALAATPGPWEHVVDDHGRGNIDASIWADSIGYYVTEKISSGERHIADAQHIAAHGPDVALAIAEADLQAVQHYERAVARSGQHPDYELAAGAVEVQMKFRALPFAAHPDYDERWRP